MTARLGSKKSIAIGLSVVLVGVILVVLIIQGLGGGSSADPKVSVRTDLQYPATTQADIDRAKSQVDKKLTYDIVNADPTTYKNKVIQWPAKVFTAPEDNGDTIYLQAYAEESDKPYVISYTNPAFEVKEGDYLLVTGVIAGVLDGENAFGADANRIAIKANVVEQSDRTSLFEPEVDSKTVNQTSSQNNFVVTLDKVVRSKNETRLYILIKNNSANEVSFYPGSAKIVQQGKQYEEKYVSEHESLPTTYKPGVVASGSIVFPTLNNLDDLTIYLDEPYASGQYELKWSEMVFKI
jgi:hypothetical protein